MGFKSLYIGGLVLCMPAVAISHAYAQSNFYYDANKPPIINVEIEGQSFKLAIDTNNPKIVLLNADAAKKFNSKDKTFFGANVSIDGQRLKGNVQRKNIIVNGKKFSTWVAWFPKRQVTAEYPKLSGLDGVIGIGALDNLGQVNLINKSASGKSQRTYAFKNKLFPFITQKQGGYNYEIHLDLLKNSNVSHKVGNYLISSGQLSEDGETRAKQTVMFDIKKQTRRLKNNNIELLGIKPAYFDFYLSNKQNQILEQEDDAKEQGKDIVAISGKLDPKKPIAMSIGTDILSNCSGMNFNFKKSTISLFCY